MRLFPATKTALAACLLLALAPASARAQQGMSTAQQQALQGMMNASPQLGAQAIQGAQKAVMGVPARGSGGTTPTYYKPGETQDLTQAQVDQLLQDSQSPQSKADRLAARHQYERNLEKSLGADAGEDTTPPPPQDIEELQAIGEGMSGNALDDAGEDNLPANDGDDKGPGAALDLRRDAQREAALSFGARGGLAKRNFEIMERLKGFEATLDSVFNFRALLVKAPSGLLIEPPIVRESIDSLVVEQGGNEAAVADRIYDINKQAKIVTAPRDWRTYLVQTWVSRVPKPPRLLWPKNDIERARWTRWVSQGWRAGAMQADEMFQANLARLGADFNGMVRYRSLLTQGMISQPYAMHEDRGVTGTKTVMRVGDRALRITGPAQFLTGSELWKPADR